ncbi:helix-turn-helix transcriptional regulator [Streptomyces lydicus]|uniref:helix-turn-helix domain-containing protein n=1 Tax=Streptomyces lydicus TaxID=47763 RepID=UPI0036CE8CA0
MTAQEARAQPQRVRNLHTEQVPTAQAMIAGGSLREHRERLKLTLDEAAERARQLQAAAGAPVRFSSAKLSRLETGQQKFKQADLKCLCGAYGIEDQSEQQRLSELTTTANRRPWYQDWSDIFSNHLRTYLSFEEAAQRIRAYEPQLLHGLLQTPDYARAVFRVMCPNDSEREIARRVELREERADRFARSEGKKLIVVIDESTLLRPYGSYEIMRRQLDHLISLRDNPRYLMRIAEQGRLDMPTLIGPTTIFDFAEQVLPDLCYMEHYLSGLLLQEKEQVNVQAMAFDRLRNACLRRDVSTRRLRALRRRA